MSATRTKQSILDDEFLVLRGRLLEVAAGFDRLDRASGDVEIDSRRRLLAEAARLVAGAGPDRAEQLQLLFSRDYDNAWRAKMEV